MQFDVRKLKSQPRSRSKKEWDLRNYRPRKSKFANVKAFRGQTMTKEVIKIFGEEIVKAVKEEAKKASGRGAGIPKSQRFYDSFSYEIVKGGKIKLKSDWEWVNKYLLRKDPYEMSWLFRRRGESKVIPLKTETGEVIFRQAPLMGSRGWIHPAIAKYNFVDKGIEIGEQRAIRRAINYFKTKK